MKTRAELLKSLGLDPSDSRGFRTSVQLSVVTPGEGLPADTKAALDRINASGFVKRQLSENDVYVHTIEAANSRLATDRWAFLSESTLQNIARESYAIITGHKSGGFFSDSENPYGRVFAGQIEKKDDRTRTVVQFYMLRDHSPNGPNAPSTDDLDKGLVGGTLFDVSVGLKTGGTGRVTCDVCGLDLFASCRHIPGSTRDFNGDEMSGTEIARQKARGVPGGAATFTFNDWHPKELSFVVDAALEGAGTALSTHNTNTQPTDRRQEATMYSKELKIKLGLSESATDAEVDAKLAELQSGASQAKSLQTKVKEQADAAFAEKWKEKLGDDVFGEIKDLANRDALAEKLSTKVAAPAGPPIGDPMRGVAAAAAPSKTAPNSQLQQDSEEAREIIGEFKTEEELNAKVLTSPLAALQKCLGVKTLRFDAEMKKRDKQAVEYRRQMFEIPTPAAAAATK